MAVAISSRGKSITLSICGCYGCGTNGCGHFVKYEEIFNPNRATPITRMYLHGVFGRGYKFQYIADLFSEYVVKNDCFKTGENGVEIMKKLILADCETDKTCADHS